MPEAQTKENILLSENSEQREKLLSTASEMLVPLLAAHQAVRVCLI
jgi:hypothetical protein